MAVVTAVKAAASAKRRDVLERFLFGIIRNVTDEGAARRRTSSI
jgi:hypothetical protein